jgi:hypothetical protein
MNDKAASVKLLGNAQLNSEKAERGSTEKDGGSSRGPNDPANNQGSGERELPPRPETCNEVVLDYMDTLEAKLKAALAANADLEREYLDLRAGYELHVALLEEAEAANAAEYERPEAKVSDIELDAMVCYGTSTDEQWEMAKELQQYRALKSRSK